jgi:hypothetical protein
MPIDHEWDYPITYPKRFFNINHIIWFLVGTIYRSKFLDVSLRY